MKRGARNIEGRIRSGIKGISRRRMAGIGGIEDGGNGPIGPSEAKPGEERAIADRGISERSSEA